MVGTALCRSRLSPNVDSETAALLKRQNANIGAFHPDPIHFDFDWRVRAGAIEVGLPWAKELNRPIELVLVSFGLLFLGGTIWTARR